MDVLQRQHRIVETEPWSLGCFTDPSPEPNDPKSLRNQLRRTSLAGACKRRRPVPQRLGVLRGVDEG